MKTQNKTNETEISNYIGFETITERENHFEELKFFLKVKKQKFKLLGYGWNKEYKHYFQIEITKEQTAQDLINETETEPFTIEERTDLNINKVTHDKVRRTNKW